MVPLFFYIENLLPRIPSNNRLHLEEIQKDNLFEFYKTNNLNKKYNENQTSKELNKQDPRSYVYFIWMGNSINEKVKNTINDWKSIYTNKQIIVWVDDDSFNVKGEQGIKQFAENNNILLLNFDNIFNDYNSFGLKNQINIEKQLIPPNWGTASDMCRYLIMYYCAGLYSDTDSPPSINIDELDFEKDFIFRSLSHMNNDLIMTKEIKNDFWREIIEKVKERYTLLKTNPEDFKKIRWGCRGLNQRFKKTMYLTGPDFLKNQVNSLKNTIKDNQKKYSIQQVDHTPFINDLSWSNKNIPESKYEFFAKMPKIEDRIKLSIEEDLKYPKLFKIKYIDLYLKIIQKMDQSKKDILLSYLDNKIINILNKDLSKYFNFYDQALIKSIGEIIRTLSNISNIEDKYNFLSKLILFNDSNCMRNQIILIDNYKNLSNPLILAIKSNKFESLKPNEIQDYDVCSALNWAIENKNIEALKKIVTFKEYLDAKDIYEETALMLAARLNQSDAVKVLVDAGADLNFQNKCKETALILAVFQRQKDTWSELIKTKKVNLDIQNEFGYTALMYAVSRKEIDAVKALVDAGANLDIKNLCEKTASMLAEEMKYTEALEIFNKKKTDLDIQNKEQH